MDISPKEFLKRVEQTVKHKQPPGANGCSSSSKASMHSNATIPPEGIKLFDGTVTDGRQHPPTSIYAQQQFLPYTNNHPSSDYYPQQLNMRYHQANTTPVPRRMDSHESFHSYQQQEAYPNQRFASPNGKHFPPQQQQSPLNTSSPSTIPSPSL